MRIWAFVAVAVLLTTLGLLWVRGESLQRLGRPELEAAAEKWKDQGIQDYDLTVQLEGRLSNVFRLQVEEGRVVAATRDGQPMRLDRLPRAWSIDGMFDTLQADVSMLEAAERGDSSGRFLKLLGVLDSQFGFPKRYLRLEMVKQGGNPEAGWRVLEFVPRPETPADE